MLQPVAHPAHHTRTPRSPPCLGSRGASLLVPTNTIPPATTALPRSPWRSPIVLVMIGLCAAALVFAATGLIVGTTKGTPKADQERVERLHDQLDSARSEHTAAVRDAKQAAAKARPWKESFDRMLSRTEEIARLAKQTQVAGALGNAGLAGELLIQLSFAVDAHDRATGELYDLPMP